MKLRSFIIGTTLLLAGCGSLNKISLTPVPAVVPVSISGAQSASLTDVQKQIVNDGVREMVAKVTVDGGESAKLIGMKAFIRPPNGGVHVCGNVNFQIEPGQSLVSAPYYIELEELDSASSAKRGQIGTDELKKSKVTFMCRHLSAL